MRWSRRCDGLPPTAMRPPRSGELPARARSIGRGATRETRWYGRWMSDMRVLYLNPFSQEVSGPDESLRVLLAALMPAGVEAHVALPAPGPQVDRYQALGARTHFVKLATLRRALSPATTLYL